MAILFKYLFATMYRKKLRSMLVILAIALSTALFFGTTGMATTVERLFTRSLGVYFGDADFVIAQDRRSPSPFFRMERFAPLAGRLVYAIGSGELSARWSAPSEDFTSTSTAAPEEVTFQIRGFSLADIQTMNPVSIQIPVVPGSAEGPDFSGRRLIIGLHTARDYGLAVGDGLEMLVAGVRQRFVIHGIAESQGFFVDGGAVQVAIAPPDTVMQLLGAPGRFTTAFVRVRPGQDMELVRTGLEEAFRGFQVNRTVSAEERAEYARTVTLPFQIMLILVVAISAFIIHSTFQVITTERLPVLGTFRSIGATRWTTNLILFVESGLYAVIGGGLGLVAGIFVLRLMTRYGVGAWLSRGGGGAHYDGLDLLRAFLLALAMSAVSSALPILRVARIPVKDLILNLFHIRLPRQPGRFWIGLLLIGLALGLPLLSPAGSLVPVFAASMVALYLGVVLIVPPLVRAWVWFFSWFYGAVFGNIGLLAARNLRDNKSIGNNITLLCIGICGLFLINTISMSLATAVTNVFSDARFDLQVWLWPADRQAELRLRQSAAVEDVMGFYQSGRIRVPQLDREIRRIIAVRPGDFERYWDFSYSRPTADIMAEIDAGRNIVLTYTLAERLGVCVGDVLELGFRRRTAAYRVIGLVSSLMYNGDFALASERFLRSDAELATYNSFYVQTRGDADSAAAMLHDELGFRGVRTRTLAETIRRNRDSSNDLFMILKGFSVLAMLLGCIGVVNNFIISCIERQRAFALMRSIGMSRIQNIIMLFIEACSVGLIGAIAGMSTSGLLFVTIPLVLRSFNLPLSIQFQSGTAVVMLTFSIMVTLLASLAPVIRVSRLQLIQVLKYE
jgi:putative ABC transport system permease protein